MRERLVAAFVGLTIVVVLLYGVPRAYFLADLVRDQDEAQAARTADLVALVVADRWKHGEPVDPALLDDLAESGETIVVNPTRGPSVSSTRESAPQTGDISATTDIARHGGTVTVIHTGDAVRDRIANALLPLVVLGVTLAVLAAGAGLLIARRMTRPLQELADAARGLGAGYFRPELPEYRTPEARAIAKALTASGQKLHALLEHERSVAVHASHELRTPVTALRLELEDLALWPETPPSVSAELRRSVSELDRLSDAIGELLAASRDLSATAEIDLDLDALVADTVARLVALGRSVTHTPDGPLPTRVNPLHIIEALELLLWGGAHVTTADRGTHLEIAITGIDPDAQQPTTSRLTPDALVAAAGGQLTRGEDGVVLRVPKRPLT